MIPASSARLVAYVERNIGNHKQHMRIQKFIILFVVILLISACGDKSPKLTPLQSDATILAFGDSLTSGSGAPKNRDYPSLLAKITNINVINKGIPGETTSQGIKRLPALLDEHHPELLILIHGGNDLLRKYSHEELKQNLLHMVYESQIRNIEVILLGVPEPGLFLKSANVYKEVANETNIPAEMKLLADILGDKSLKSDIAHPNAQGYRVLAEGISNFLKENGAL